MCHCLACLWCRRGITWDLSLRIMVSCSIIEWSSVEFHTEAKKKQKDHKSTGTQLILSWVVAALSTTRGDYAHAFPSYRSSYPSSYDPILTRGDYANAFPSYPSPYDPILIALTLQVWVTGRRQTLHMPLLFMTLTKTSSLRRQSLGPCGEWQKGWLALLSACSSQWLLLNAFLHGVRAGVAVVSRGKDHLSSGRLANASSCLNQVLRSLQTTAVLC